MSLLKQKPWQLGRESPEAFEPCSDAAEDREFEKCVADPSRRYGSGTDTDPFIFWLDDPAGLSRRSVRMQNDFAHAIARYLGMTHCWIALAHRNEGPYMAIRLGTGLDECKLRSHIYIALDEQGSLTTLDGHEDCENFANNSTFCIHLWSWETQHKRDKPRDEIDTDPIWQLSRIEGPYLDSFRPATDHSTREEKGKPAIIVTDHDRKCLTETPCEGCVQRKGEHIGRLEPRATQDICSMQGVARDLRLRIQLFKIDYDVYASLHRETAEEDEPTAARVKSLRRIRLRLSTEKEEIERILRIRVELFNIEFKALRDLQEVIKTRKTVVMEDLDDESRMSERLLRLKEEIDAEIDAAQ